MDLINTLYKEYIENTDYVYYRERDTIIIMKKQVDLECICDVSPKKYHSVNLKVIVTFNLKDPYKLVHLTKYMIDEIVSSYCYLSMEDAFNLRQTYYDYKDGEKHTECIYIDGKINGLCQSWYEDGEKQIECIYIDGKINGLYQRWYENGQKDEEFTYIDTKRNGLYQRWYGNGQKQTEFNYINDIIHGLYQEWKETGELIEECMYIAGIKMN
jgi:antitoxin component YwqK of YwqJK toxin-antitoxin module